MGLKFKVKINRGLSRLRSGTIVFLHDILMIPLAWLGAYCLRFNITDLPADMLHHALTELPVVLLVQAAYYRMFGLYRGVWRFASVPDLLRILKAVGAATLTTLVALFFYDRLLGTPRSVFPMYAMLLVMLLGGPRFLLRWIKDYAGLITGKRVLIVGAGQAGESLVRDLIRYQSNEYCPMMFVDDDHNKRGKEIHGIRVVGNSKQIPSLVQQHNIDLVIIAMPSATAGAMRRIVGYCDTAEVPCSTLPSLNDLANGRVTVDALRQVSLEDLLGRDPVNLDWEQITESLTDHSVLVTGGAGSIGSELCRQIARLSPNLLIIADNSEYNLYRLEQEFNQHFPEVMIQPRLLDVTDDVAVSALFNEFAISTVFHAAAYKHVPILESQLRAAMKNNVLGTLNVAEAAVKHQVRKFILISTDKAVDPANIMGASKRCAEIFCQNYPSQTTKFITVRFGNVLGSAGSVVPLFKRQIEQGGPVTVTHPDITRYFIYELG